MGCGGSTAKESSEGPKTTAEAPKADDAAAGGGGGGNPAVVAKVPILGDLADGKGNALRADLELGLHIIGVTKGPFNGASAAFDELEKDGLIDMVLWWDEKLGPRSKIIVESKLRGSRADDWDLKKAMQICRAFTASGPSPTCAVSGAQLVGRFAQCSVAR